MGKLSALKEGIEKAAKALDMSQAARMQRAAEQGFDTGKVWYHGTNEDFAEFSKSKIGKNDAGFYGQGFYFSDRPEVAERYAKKHYGSIEPVTGQIKPVYLKTKNPIKYDEPASEDLINYANEYINKKAENASDGANEFLSALGIDVGESQKTEPSVKIGDSARRIHQVVGNSEEFSKILDAVGYDGVMTETGEIVVFNPSQIRSKFAAFDPAQKESSNLLAQFAPIATGTGLAALGLSPDETQAAINSYIQATQGSNPILDNLNRNLQQFGMNERGVPVTGTMQATPYPMLGKVADALRVVDTPIGPVFGGAADYLDKLAQGQKTTYFDRLGAALDVIP